MLKWPTKSKFSFANRIMAYPFGVTGLGFLFTGRLGTGIACVSVAAINLILDTHGNLSVEHKTDKIFNQHEQEHKAALWWWNFTKDTKFVETLDKECKEIAAHNPKKRGCTWRPGSFLEDGEKIHSRYHWPWDEDQLPQSALEPMAPDYAIEEVEQALVVAKAVKKAQDYADSAVHSSLKLCSGCDADISGHNACANCYPWAHESCYCKDVHVSPKAQILKAMKVKN